MFCARRCKFCEQHEARISMVRAVSVGRGVRAVLVDFSGRTPCRWHRWEG